MIKIQKVTEISVSYVCTIVQSDSTIVSQTDCVRW